MHTNEKAASSGKIRVNSCPFVVLSRRKPGRPDLHADGRKSAALPQMAANLPDEIVAELARVPIRHASSFLTTNGHECTRMKKPPPQGKFVSIRVNSCPFVVLSRRKPGRSDLHANAPKSAALPQTAANFISAPVAELASVPRSTPTLVIDHECTRMHTNEENSSREIRVNS